MQAVKGYYDNGYFTPFEPVVLPDKAEVTLLFHVVTQPADSDIDEFWKEFDRLAAESAHENHLLDDEAFKRRDWAL